MVNVPKDLEKLTKAELILLIGKLAPNAAPEGSMEKAGSSTTPGIN